MKQKQENSEQFELRKKKASLWDKITRRFLKFFYSILHIKLKIFERAFQRRIICVILISNEEDMLIWKSTRAASGDRGAQNKRRGATSDFGRRHCEKAPNTLKKPKITLIWPTIIKRTFKTQKRQLRLELEHLREQLESFVEPSCRSRYQISSLQFSYFMIVIWDCSPHRAWLFFYLLGCRWILIIDYYFKF